MLIRFEVDTTQALETERDYLRAAASFFLHLAGDLPEVTNGPADDNGQVDTLLVKTGTPTPPPPLPPPAPLDSFTSAATAGAPPPPPPPAATPVTSAAAAPGAVSASEVPSHTFPTSGAAANGAGTASSAAAPPVATKAPATSPSDAPEFDSAGLPWDGRIHQTRKGVKKDGTWKIQKGADAALVESVIKELVARKGVPTLGAQVDAFPAPTGSAPPPPPPPVSLPAGSNTVPVPPVTVASDVSIVIPATAPPAPTPAAPAVGPVPASGFRELIAKISAGTKANKLDPVKVSTIVQRHGCSSLQALRDMPHLIPLVETDIDVEVLS